MVFGRDQQGLDPDDVEGLADRGVGLVTDGDAGVIRGPPLPVGGGVAGHDQSREVAGRSTRHEAATGAGGKPGQPGQYGERLVLRSYRTCRLQPRGALDRRARHDHVEQQGRLGGGGGDERQEAGAVARDHRLRQLVEGLHHVPRVVPLRAEHPLQQCVE
jgi:hypothetical protein